MTYSQLSGKVVIVTGATSGIGYATAKVFAANGASTVVASIEKEKLPDIMKEFESLGYNILPVYTDVTREEDCKNLIDKTIEKYGRIDILINNAGISMRALLADLHLDVIRRVMDVNFWGTVYCTKYALPYLLENYGSVIGISSIAGFKGLPGRTGYSASKFALIGFLESVRIENRKKGLHVLIVGPWFIRSNIRKNALGPDGQPQGESPLPEKNLSSPEYVAEKIVRATLLKKRTLLLPWRSKLFVPLNRLFPRLFDRIVYNEMAKEPDSPFQ
ncbi:MAG: short-chain dehydrogenase [Bacteroides sp. SM23_62_1]|nr:MAG: short-chain dehydrogenase [Bacteroides sp. SM23_62_1]